MDNGSNSRDTNHIVLCHIDSRSWIISLENYKLLFLSIPRYNTLHFGRLMIYSPNCATKLPIQVTYSSNL